MLRTELSKSAFRNIKVLDFGQWVAGPATARMFADLGADVTRIDPPGGPLWDSPASEILNRGKKSIVLDLKNDADLEKARRMTASADILVENFRPGVMKRLGLGADEVHALNPALIYLSIPGFASSDGELADIPAWEAVIAAASGQFTDMGLNRVLMGINPSFSPVTIASAYASVLASFAAASALLSREDTGFGDYIEVPIASALTEGLVYNSMYVKDLPERYKSLREREIERREKAGLAFDLEYDELQGFLDPFYRSYFCSDGRPVYVVSSCHKKHAHRTLEVMGLLDEARAAGIPEMEDWYCSSSEWPEGTDCALGLYPTSRKWADWLSERMKKVFLQKTSYEWEKIFGEAGVPVSAHRTTGEWLKSIHPLRSGLLQQSESPRYGNITGPGPFVWLESLEDPDASADTAAGAAPEKSAAEAVGPAADNGLLWLKGVKVLDMSNVIAGPMTAENLIRFGAEVIKLDPVNPTYDPWNTVLMGLRIHCGKKSILADIKSNEGKAVFRRLLEWADVVVFNGPERQLRPLGLDPDSLKAVNPDLVLCRLDAWGGPNPGPHSDYLGYDDLVQASTGIMSRFGGSINTPEEHAHLGTIDVLTGFAASFSIAAALYLKRKTGKTGIARTSLSAMGQLLQIPFMYDYNGRPPFDEPSGRESRGDGPLYRCYEASDGWFFFAAPNIDIKSIDRIEGLDGAAAYSGLDLENFLSARFKKQGASHWTGVLKKHGIGAVRLGSLADLRRRFGSSGQTDPHAGGGTFQFTTYADHPGSLHVEMVAPCAIRPERAVINVPPPAEKFGNETREILELLGYSEREIESMFDKGVVSAGWGSRYLPD